MFQEDIFKTVLFSSLLSVISSNIPICLTWRQHNNYLEFVCHVDDLHLSVILKDPDNDELALCSIPLPHYKCFSHVSWVNVTQNLTTNETVFSVHKKDSSKVNGNWTCQHGYHGNAAYIEVEILDQVQKSAVLNVFVWAFAGFGIAYLIIEICSVGIKYRDIYCGKLITTCLCEKKKLRYLSIFVFLVSTALYAGIITTFTIIPYEDSASGRCLFLICGITYTLLILISSGLFKSSRATAKKDNKADQKDERQSTEPQEEVEEGQGDKMQEARTGFKYSRMNYK